MTIEIYWDDLTEECKKRIAEQLGLEDGDDNNWTFVPITSFYVEDVIQ